MYELSSAYNITTVTFSVQCSRSVIRVSNIIIISYDVREREWAEGTVSSLPGTLNFRMKFCHSTGIARSGGGVRASTTSYA